MYTMSELKKVINSVGAASDTTEQNSYEQSNNSSFISNQDFLKVALTYLDCDPRRFSICNQFVSETYRALNYSIPQLGHVSTFLPRCSIIPQLLSADITAIPANRILDLSQADIGDIVVFYSLCSGNNIAHTMIVAENNVLLGSQNFTTFNNISTPKIEYIDLTKETLVKYTDRVVAISPNNLAQFHNFNK